MLNPKQGQTSISGLAKVALANEKYGGYESRSISLNSRSIYLPPQTEARLKELSITTVEDLVGVKIANRSGLASILRSSGVSDPETVIREIQVFETPLLENFARVKSIEYSHGALLTQHTRTSTLTKTAAASTAFQGRTEVSLLNGFMPSIRNQGRRGTCVAFATCAVLEYEYAAAKGSSRDFSEQFQYWNCKQHDGSPSEGTFIDISFALIQRDGCCQESTWPYVSAANSSNPTYGPPPSSARSEAGQSAVRQAVEIQDCKNVASLKTEISNGHPLAIGVPTFDSWEDNPNCRLTGNITMPFPDEQPTAGHAMVLVGYGESTDFAGGGFFIVRNSWGTTWGTQSPFGAGYGTIPYNYIRNHNHAACFIRNV